MILAFECLPIWISPLDLRNWNGLGFDLDLGFGNMMDLTFSYILEVELKDYLEILLLH